MPLLFNEKADPKERGRTPMLSTAAATNAISILNQCLFSSESIEEGSNAHCLLQQFIYYYENLCYHHAITFGLWACEDPDDVIDPHGKLFQIK